MEPQVHRKLTTHTDLVRTRGPSFSLGRRAMHGAGGGQHSPLDKQRQLLLVLRRGRGRRRDLHTDHRPVLRDCRILRPLHHLIRRPVGIDEGGSARRQRALDAASRRHQHHAALRRRVQRFGERFAPGPPPQAGDTRWCGVVSAAQRHPALGGAGKHSTERDEAPRVVRRDRETRRQRHQPVQHEPRCFAPVEALASVNPRRHLGIGQVCTRTIRDGLAEWQPGSERGAEQRR